MHCSSFSKTLAPGYRVGWVAAGRFLPQLIRQKLTASLATAIPVQLALARYLARGSFERHLRGLRIALKDSRDHYAALISTHFPQGTRVSRPQGGYFLWVELPGAVDALELHRLAMADGISLAPGPMFSASGSFRNFVRINYGHLPSPRVEAALARVGEIAVALTAG